VISAEGLEILGLLSADERKLMREIVRIAKSRTNAFHEGKLTRRKACEALEVPDLLHSLSNKGLVRPVRRRMWATTKLGREIEHYLQAKDFDANLAYRVAR